ncbi:MAG: hypothetical protein GY940_35925, partial [bacterium]|nr:hypothetical protein [bacterium]
MMGLNKMTVWKFVFTLTILMTMSSYAFPWWYVNASENGFGGGAESSSDLESYIIEGAGYFLESYSDTLLFMKKVELSGRDGLDHGELSAMLGSALTNMEQA